MCYSNSELLFQNIIIKQMDIYIILYSVNIIFINVEWSEMGNEKCVLNTFSIEARENSKNLSWKKNTEEKKSIKD